jgi:hypothetical protein
MSFEQKYLKYKNKYSSLKNMKGGTHDSAVTQIRGCLDTITSEIETANEALRKLTIAPSGLDTPKLPLEGKWKVLVEQMKKDTNGNISEEKAIALINAELKKRTPTIDNLDSTDIAQIIKTRYT